MPSLYYLPLVQGEAPEQHKAVIFSVFLPVETYRQAPAYSLEKKCDILSSTVPLVWAVNALNPAPPCISHSLENDGHAWGVFSPQNQASSLQEYIARKFTGLERVSHHRCVYDVYIYI